MPVLPLLRRYDLLIRVLNFDWSLLGNFLLLLRLSNNLLWLFSNLSQSIHSRIFPLRQWTVAFRLSLLFILFPHVSIILTIW